MLSDCKFGLFPGTLKLDVIKDVFLGTNYPNAVYKITKTKLYLT